MEFRSFNFSLLILLFSSLLIIGCKNSDQNKKNNSIQINLSKSRNAKLSEFFERIDYLLLDYSDHDTLSYLPLQKGHERFNSFASTIGFLKNTESGQIYFREENSYSYQAFC